MCSKGCRKTASPNARNDVCDDFSEATSLMIFMMISSALVIFMMIFANQSTFSRLDEVTAITILRRGGEMLEYIYYLGLENNYR